MLQIDFVEEISEDVLAKSLEPYEEHQTEKDDDADDDATLKTPQGHFTQPKHRSTYYTSEEELLNENLTDNVGKSEKDLHTTKDEL